MYTFIKMRRSGKMMDILLVSSMFFVMIVVAKYVGI